MELSAFHIALLARAYQGAVLDRLALAQLPGVLAWAASELPATQDPYQTLLDAGLNASQIEQVKNASEWRDPWQASTLADAYRPRPALEYAVSGLLPLPSLSVVYGAPGTLKTMLVMDLMVCVVGGKLWLPPAPWAESPCAPFQTRTSPAVWIDFDNGRRRTDERFEALARQRNLPSSAPLAYYSMPSPWLDATDPAEINALAIRVRDRQARLVVIDNLGAVSGKADENSADMAAVLGGFRRLAEDTGAAVILIHHQRKSNGYTGRSGDALRGHSSIEAAIDLALLVERDGQADLLTVKPTKVRGSPVAAFAAVWACTRKSPGDAPGGELATAMFYGYPTEEDDGSDRAIEQAILSVLTGHAMSKSQLKAEVKKLLPAVGVNRLGAAIDRLVSQGRLRATAGDRTAKQISLPGDGFEAHRESHRLTGLTREAHEAVSLTDSRRLTDTGARL